MSLVNLLLQGSPEQIRSAFSEKKFAGLDEDDFAEVVSCLQSGDIDGHSIPDWNRIAAIELLKNRNDPSVVQFFREYLSRPLDHFHKYIVPWLCIWGRESRSDYECHPLFIPHREEFASFLCDRFRELYSSDADGGEWKDCMTAAIAVSTSALDPRAMILRIAPYLSKVEEFPLTAFLHALEQSAVKLKDDPEIPAILKPFVEEALGVFLADNSEPMGNKPGNGARLLRLLSFCGEDRESLGRRLDGYYLADRVLALFDHRMLEERN